MRVKYVSRINLASSIILLLFIPSVLLLTGCKQYTPSGNENAGNSNSVDSGTTNPPLFGWQTDTFCSTANGAFILDARCSFKVASSGLPSGEFFRIKSYDEYLVDDSGFGESEVFLSITIGQIDTPHDFSSNAELLEFINSRWPGINASAQNTGISPFVFGGVNGTKVEFNNRAVDKTQTVQIYAPNEVGGYNYLFASFKADSQDRIDAYFTEIQIMAERITW